MLVCSRTHSHLIELESRIIGRMNAVQYPFMLSGYQSALVESPELYDADSEVHSSDPPFRGIATS